jgi:hypothetical protein
VRTTKRIETIGGRDQLEQGQILFHQTIGWSEGREAEGHEIEGFGKSLKKIGKKVSKATKKVGKVVAKPTKSLVKAATKVGKRVEKAVRPYAGTLISAGAAYLTGGASALASGGLVPGETGGIVDAGWEFFGKDKGSAGDPGGPTGNYFDSGGLEAAGAGGSPPAEESAKKWLPLAAVAVAAFVVMRKR